MAELAAKLRAKFKRRHSAIPGVPSLLTRSSVRSSSGSHGSSLFRTHSHGAHSVGHVGGETSSADGELDVDGKSRSGSSRISEVDLPHQVNGDGRGTKTDLVGGVREVAIVTGRDGDEEQEGREAAHAREVGKDGGDEPRIEKGAEEDGQGEGGGSDEGQQKQQQQQELQLQVSPHISDRPTSTSTSTSSTSSPELNVAADVSSSGADIDMVADPVPDPEPLPHVQVGATRTTTTTTPATATATATATDHQSTTSAAALTAPAPAPATATVAAPTVPATADQPPPAPPTPLEPATKSPPSATPAGIQPSRPSDMSGSDRQTAPRALSSIFEQPSPDQVDLEKADAKHVSSSTPAHAIDNKSTVTTTTTTLIAPPPVDQPPRSPSKKRDDAKPALLPTPRITTSTTTTRTTSRPLHIPLPTASFGPPPPASLSPGAIYSANSTAAPSAPTSPLARYSETLAVSNAVVPPPTSAPAGTRPSAPSRRQSLLSTRQSTLIQTLLRGSNSDESKHLDPDQLLAISGTMVTRKIWVKRPGGSATLVTINEDHVVDDVRDMILRKYANSLGRQFDSPDIILRIRPADNQEERTLGPEEPMARTIDAYFPSGQTIDDALLIDVPLRRTPRASPRAGPPHAPHIQYYVAEDARPPETAGDYFGPGAVPAAHPPVTVTAPSNGIAQHPHAISVLSTGQVPQIPSPGSRRARDYRERPERPRLGRQHTSSPTLINLISSSAHPGAAGAGAAVAAAAPHGTQALHGTARPRSRTHSSAASDKSQAAPQAPPIPTPPPPEASAVPQRVATPPPRTSSPRPAGSARPKKSKKNVEPPSLPKGMLNGTVPPINVLIVEDNIINLKLLEAFVKRLRVRWSTAMNGRDAVTKWRAGGFHLVLMDIQLPIMSGLDATREIRRLERVNSIGVFSSAAAAAPVEVKGEPDEKDKLEDMDLFKSPVIIVALTASSLQSDRHEALAAGCNDFLTKPVNFVWLERKVMEWGCMQALIDFDGWRKWKDFAPAAVDDKAKVAAQRAKVKKNRSSLTQAVSASA